MDGADFDLQSCLERVRCGNEVAARELFRHFYPYVLAVVRAHLPARTHEEDLCQMTFVKAFTSLDQYSGKGAFSYWLSRIAVNTCLNQLRSEQRHPELRHADLDENALEMLDRLSSEDRSRTEDPEAARELVAQILTELSPGDRLVITLIHLEDRSVNEVASMTGWNPVAIKVRVFRARQKLKKILERIASANRS